MARRHNPSGRYLSGPDAVARHKAAEKEHLAAARVAEAERRSSAVEAHLKAAKAHNDAAYTNKYNADSADARSDSDKADAFSNRVGDGKWEGLSPAARAPRPNPSGRYLFDPMRLIHRAIDGGFIDPGYAESPHAMRVAEEVAEEWSYRWPKDEGFGSSDFTYALKDFLDALGVPTHYVGGRLTKKNPRATAGRRNPVRTYSGEMEQRHGALKIGQAVDIRVDAYTGLTLRVTGVSRTHGEISVTGAVLATDLHRRHMLAKVPKVGDVVTVPLEAVDRYSIIPRG
jgi:hypothetical protein